MKEHQILTEEDFDLSAKTQKVRGEQEGYIATGKQDGKQFYIKQRPRGSNDDSCITKELHALRYIEELGYEKFIPETCGASINGTPAIASAVIEEGINLAQKTVPPKESAASATDRRQVECDDLMICSLLKRTVSDLDSSSTDNILFKITFDHDNNLTGIQFLAIDFGRAFYVSDEYSQTELLTSDIPSLISSVNTNLGIKPKVSLSKLKEAMLNLLWKHCTIRNIEQEMIESIKQECRKIHINEGTIESCAEALAKNIERTRYMLYKNLLLILIIENRLSPHESGWIRYMIYNPYLPLKLLESFTIEEKKMIITNSMANEDLTLADIPVKNYFIEEIASRITHDTGKMQDSTWFTDKTTQRFAGQEITEHMRELLRPQLEKTKTQITHDMEKQQKTRFDKVSEKLHTVQSIDELDQMITEHAQTELRHLEQAKTTKRTSALSELSLQPILDYASICSIM